MLPNNFQKLIHRIITGNLNRHFIITSCKFGVRKEDGTEKALLHQKEIIIKVPELGCISFAFLLDFSEVSNSINRWILPAKSGYGIRKKYVGLSLIAYASNGTHFASIDNSR